VRQKTSQWREINSFRDPLTLDYAAFHALFRIGHIHEFDRALRLSTSHRPKASNPIQISNKLSLKTIPKTPDFPPVH